MLEKNQIREKQESIFLADRIEAACRTLKDPTMVDFRQKIQRIGQ